jgi:hypothetical protein
VGARTTFGRLFVGAVAIRQRQRWKYLPILTQLGMHLTQVAPTDGGSEWSNLEGLAIWE